MKILHLASFSGNHGDLVNHDGFKQWFNKRILEKKEWHQIEIREIFRKNKSFQKHVLDVANEYDLVIIGGGNYFETWPTDTWSGTSLDLTPKSFRGIRTPFFFNALGVDSGQGISKNAQMHFREMIDAINSREDNILSVRNDGSEEQLLQLNALADYFWVPDGGFYIETGEFAVQEPKNLVINVASDMPNIRFNSNKGDSIEFARRMANYITKIHKIVGFKKIIFTQHVIGDLGLINTIISMIDEKIRREIIEVSSYGMKKSNFDEIISIYKSASLIIAQRFHANIVAMRLEKPVIGLSNYPQISNLYKELDSSNYCVQLESNDDVDRLVELSKIAISEPDTYTKKLRSNLKVMYDKGYQSHNQIANSLKKSLEV